MRRLNIVKVIDQWGWSYDFIGREQKKYSRHNIIIQKYNEIDLKDIDIVYIHSTNIDQSITNELPLEAYDKGIKVIGGYGGDPKFWSNDVRKDYPHADLLVAISPQIYRFLKSYNRFVPFVFLPECIDTEYFKPIRSSKVGFICGWAGSDFEIKRKDILEKLKYKVIKAEEWGPSHFYKDRSHDHMVEFYNSVSVFVLPSITECMPRVVLEAMACGLPVLSTGVGCVPFLLEDQWLTPVEPREAVISIMNNRLDVLKYNPYLLRKVGDRNRSFIEKYFSWKSMQPMWDNIFDMVYNGETKKIIHENRFYVNHYTDHFGTALSNKSKIKIAYTLPDNRISGGVAVILQHVNRLLARGYNVFLLSKTDDIKNIEWFDNKVSVISLESGLPVYLDNIDILVYTAWSTVYDFENVRAERKIYFVQSDETRFVEEKEMKKKVLKTYEKYFEFMTEARWIMAWLKSKFKKESYYVPNGLDKSLFYNDHSVFRKNINKKIVLLEGAIDIPFKGVENAYNAVKDLDCDIWIVSNSGKPKNDWRYNNFFESISMDEMRHVYSMCDVFIKMSEIEGFFGPPMEAMACGCAVVVGKCTGYDEYIKHEYNALVVEMGDIESASRCVNRLLFDEDLRNRLVENGHKTIEKWNWETTIDKLENVILYKK